MNEIPKLEPIKTKVRKFRGELLAEWDCTLMGPLKVPCTLRVYGKIVPAEYESLSGRATVMQYPRGIEDMITTIDDVEIYLGEEAESNIAASILEE